MILPGFGSAPPAPPPLQPLPEREDPSVQQARERQRLSELQRRGRRAAIAGGGVDDAPLGAVSRPQARTARLG